MTETERIHEVETYIKRWRRICANEFILKEGKP